MQEVAHEVLLKSRRKYEFKWKQKDELTEERIVGLDIWGKHGHRVICKGLEMLQEDYHVEERRICVVCQHEDDSKQGHIVFTLLQVDYDRCDGICDLLGDHGTNPGWESLLTTGANVGAVGVAERWGNYVGRR